jgi:hypothetical protein
VSQIPTPEEHARAWKRPAIETFASAKKTRELLRTLREAESKEEALTVLCSITYMFLLCGRQAGKGPLLDYLDDAACGWEPKDWGTEDD